MDIQRILIQNSAGLVALPVHPMNHAADGGHLLVNPPRPVWERCELDACELTRWASLVAATGQAMLETLPQLSSGCLNYWEAGNNSLNDQAYPVGPKNPKSHRKMHLHVFGRSPQAQHPDWKWGEPPRFPKFADSALWVRQFSSLGVDECEAIRVRIEALLQTKYAKVFDQD
jgi:diadenosine tetraphosphate (Ap4A) HIT family hydrolase